MLPIVQIIYEQPASQDQGLRTAVEEKSLPHADELDNDTLHGEFLLKLINHLSTERIQDKAKMLEYQATIQGMHAVNDQFSAQSTQARGDLHTVARLLQQLRGCTGCDSRFNLRAEKSGPAGKYFIRCIGCKTKHTV